jgi:hypothetical protein
MNDTEFYAVLKLVSGEEIFSLIDIDLEPEDPIIILQNPVKMKIITKGLMVQTKIEPWMSLPEDDIYMIRLSNVITMTEINPLEHDDLIDSYNEFLQRVANLKSPDWSFESELTSKMGSLGTVSDARGTLEKVFKLPPAIKEASN